MSTESTWKDIGYRPAWIATLLMTVLVSALIVYLWSLLQDDRQQRMQSAFRNDIAEIVTSVSAHMDAYEQILKGGRSFFMGSQTVTRAEWHSYVLNLELSKQYPGIQGVGYALLVPAAGLASHQQRIRNEGFPGYRIWPEGKRDTYTSIIYLEPFDWRNQRAFGYDMFAEATRHEAMARARDTGSPALSGKVLLVQEIDEAPQAGTLLYVPMYRKDTALDSPAQRRKALLGWVYSPYRMDNLLQGMLANHARDFRLRIYDTGETGAAAIRQHRINADSLLFDSLHAAGPSAPESPILFHYATQMLVAGRPWLLDFDALPAFAQSRGFAPLYAETGGMALIGLLLIILTWNLFNTQRRTMLLAKRLTLSLRENEAKFETLIGNMTEGMALHEMVYDDAGRAIDYRILDVNPAYETQTGLSAAASIGQLGSRVYGVNPAPYLDEFGGVAESGRPYKFDSLFLSPGRHFEISVFSPGPHQFATVFTDISARKQAEKQLRESESIFRAMAETMPLAIYVSTGQQQTGLYINRAFVGLFGYRLEEVPSISEWWPLAYPDDAYRQQISGEWQGKVARAMESASDIEPMETVVTCKDGSKKNILWGFITLGEKNYAFGLDLTLRKQAEASTRKLAQVVEQAGESILITDRHGIIEYVNPAFTRLTGYTAEEVVGKNPKVLNSGRQTQALYEKMWTTILGGDVWQAKLIDRRKDGSFYPAMMTISPIRSETGEITHFVGLQQDLSENEALENQFYQAQKMEAMGTLVGGIAHEFNNALAGMTGNLYLARSKVLHMPEVIRKLDRIEQLAFRSAELIKSLLSFARKGIIRKTCFDLPAFVHEIIRMHKVSLPEIIRLELDIETRPMTVNWDRNLLQQAVMNLINNARDACREQENPVIRIQLRGFVPDKKFLARHPETAAGEVACLSIRDNGSGIAADSLQHIFDPFYTTKEVGQGTGLGLSMVVGAVQTHQGCIEVDSSEGKGSEFRVYLPLQKQEHSPQHAGPEVAIEYGAGETILLADDDAHMLSVGKEVLEALGYQVRVASDGLEAVALFKEHRDDIALVLSDIMMPGLNGQKAVERIRSLRPDIKVIYTTGYNPDEERLADIHSDDPVLHKPYDIEELSRIIRRLLTA